MLEKLTLFLVLFRFRDQNNLVRVRERLVMVKRSDRPTGEQIQSEFGTTDISNSVPFTVKVRKYTLRKCSSGGT